MVGHWTLPPAAYLSNDRRIGGPGLLRALASVNTNLGHAQAASGSLGLMKAILALQHGVVPRNLQFTPLPDELARIETKLFVPHEATPWGANGHPPTGGVVVVRGRQAGRLGAAGRSCSRSRGPPSRPMRLPTAICVQLLSA